MPFTLRFDEVAVDAIKDLTNGDANGTAKLEKVNRAFGNLQQNPRHPGLNSYEYQNFRGGPPGVKIWHSYVENNTPGAWRIFWRYGPDETGKNLKGKDVRVPVITILSVGPHT
ncbi:MAG TPA: hypothetical protein VGG25_18635 [Streptosporangiaceae bacterium]